MITHGSTFSGIGAPEVAAEMLGWENIFHCEINPFGRKVLDYYFPNAESYEDITKTDFTKWRDKVTVLTGGFPCQPFSYAGKRRGAEDDRYLWPYMLRCLKIDLGLYSTVWHGGKEIIVPGSISFALMDEEEFERFFNRAVDAILSTYLRGTDRDALIEEIENFK